MNAASPTFYDQHASSIRKHASDILCTASRCDPVLTAMEAHLCLNPITGEFREIEKQRPDMVRLYFQFLQENERLPETSQLEMEEVQ